MNLLQTVCNWQNTVSKLLQSDEIAASR